MFLPTVNQLPENRLPADVVLLLEKEVLGERGAQEGENTVRWSDRCPKSFQSLYKDVVY